MLIPLLYQDIHLLDQDIHLFLPNRFWPFVPHMSHTKTSSGSIALLLGGPLAPYELCPPIGRPFDAIWALPSYWVALWRHFSATQSQGWA